ncbi:unnamed protein product [Camellia sinensis]
MVQKIQILTPNIGVVYRAAWVLILGFWFEIVGSRNSSGGVRPFGVSLLVAGFDDKGPQLYQVDPSGSYFSWKASAMGKNVSDAKTFLEKRSIFETGIATFFEDVEFGGRNPVRDIVFEEEAGVIPLPTTTFDQSQVPIPVIAQEVISDPQPDNVVQDNIVQTLIQDEVIVPEEQTLQPQPQESVPLRRSTRERRFMCLARFLVSDIAILKYTDDMELDDAVHTAILTLILNESKIHARFEGQISEKNIEIGIIGTDKKFRVLTPSEIADYLEEVE